MKYAKVRTHDLHNSTILKIAENQGVDILVVENETGMQFSIKKSEVEVWYSGKILVPKEVIVRVCGTNISLMIFSRNDIRLTNKVNALTINGKVPTIRELLNILPKETYYVFIDNINNIDVENLRIFLDNIIDYYGIDGFIVKNYPESIKKFLYEYADESNRLICEQVDL